MGDRLMAYVAIISCKHCKAPKEVYKEKIFFLNSWYSFACPDCGKKTTFRGKWAKSQQIPREGAILAEECPGQ